MSDKYLGHQPRHRLGFRWADALSPVDQMLRYPFHVRAVHGRHVHRRCCEVSEPAATGVAGGALAAMPQLNQGCGDALSALDDQVLRNAETLALL